MFWDLSVLEHASIFHHFFLHCGDCLQYTINIIWTGWRRVRITLLGADDDALTCTITMVILSSVQQVHLWHRIITSHHIMSVFCCHIHPFLTGIITGTAHTTVSTSISIYHKMWSSMHAQRVPYKLIKCSDIPFLAVECLSRLRQAALRARGPVPTHVCGQSWRPKRERSVSCRMLGPVCFGD